MHPPTKPNAHNNDHEDPVTTSIATHCHRINAVRPTIHLPSGYTIASLQQSVDLQHRYDRLLTATQTNHNQTDIFESTTDSEESDAESTTSTVDYNLPNLYNSPTAHDTVD